MSIVVVKEEKNVVVKAVGIQPPSGGSGDMLAAVYDPAGVNADAFNMANMVEAADANKLTDAERIKLTNLSGINTGDQDISGISTNASAISTLQAEQTTQDAAIALNTAKIGITPTQANDILTNNAKQTNATHTGEVTGSGVLTVDSTAISNKTLKATPVGTEEVLINDAGTLKKTTTQAIANLSTGGGSATHIFKSSSIWNLSDTNYKRTQYADIGYYDNSLSSNVAVNTFAAASSTSLNVQNSFILTPAECIIRNFQIDFMYYNATITQFKVCVWAGDPANLSGTKINLLEEVVNVSGSRQMAVLTPGATTIPANYTVNIMLLRVDGGTGNCYTGMQLILEETGN